MSLISLNMKYNRIVLAFFFLCIQHRFSKVLAQTPPANLPPEAINDGTLGIVPELFDEEDDTDLGLYLGDDIPTFLAICGSTAKCEDCDLVNRNADRNKCDTLANHNFQKLRLGQQQIKAKQAFLSDFTFTGIEAFLYLICVLLGVYLLWKKQFRVRTLWDKFAFDPTQGMRSFRYERMLFKFDYDDPGANPEDLTGYEDYVLYNSSEDEDAPKTPFMVTKGALGVEQLLQAKKKKEMAELERQSQAKASIKNWPWETPNYDFTRVLYREGLRRDMDDWGEEEDYNFSANI